MEYKGDFTKKYFPNKNSLLSLILMMYYCDCVTRYSA